MTMPRRAFLASSAAAIAAPVAIASPVIPAATDAVFAAIAAFRQANAAWRDALNACDAADHALQAESAMGLAAIRIPMGEATLELRTNEEISAFLPALRESCIAKGIAWDDASMAGVTEGLRDRLEAERERVEMIRSRVNADVLEERQETALRHAGQCADTALATVPTTLAGLHAFAELMTEMCSTEGLFLDHHEDSSRGLATLATACRNLLPTA